MRSPTVNGYPPLVARGVFTTIRKHEVKVSRLVLVSPVAIVALYFLAYEANLEGFVLEGQSFGPPTYRIESLEKIFLPAYRADVFIRIYWDRWRRQGVSKHDGSAE